MLSRLELAEAHVVRRKARRPRNAAASPSSASRRTSWLYFATRSLRAGAPVLIWPQFVATARSAIVVSSVSPLRGSHVLLRPVDAGEDAEALHAVSHRPAGDPAIWTYLPYGPYEDPAHMRELLEWAESSDDPRFYALVKLPDELPTGLASYLRMEPEFGVIEIGHIWFGVSLQRTTAATEAIYLLVRRAFDDLGYRRLEWKCNVGELIGEARG